MVNLRRDIIQGLVRLRILRAAQRGPTSGVELSDDLMAAGHRVGPGTLYPLLHDLEKAGWVKSKGKTVKGKRRRYYRITKKGRAQLDQALIAVNQFLFEGLEQLPAAHDGAVGAALDAID
ncbi:MAG: helix-turn-helix transcriptional regulator [Chloroflexi bacterium]|nr:helix-turn-helix transcriptional regulator [Chloroflexota bacterium]